MHEYSVNTKLLIRGCRQKKRLSQEKLYQLYYGYAMSICLRYAKNSKEATEILNIGFLKVFTRLDQYDDDLPFKAWLRKILINAALDFYRSHYQKQKQKTIFSPEILEQKVGSTSFSIPSSQDMLPIVQQLSPAYRTVFNLYVMEGYKHGEIAEMLNISVNTSKTNLFRAKQKLKDLILKQQGKLKKKM